MKTLQPLIQQRADPFIGKHTDGYYYFTASVPAYDRIEVRRARTIAELATATPVDVWHKPDIGPLSELIWAPEIHRINGPGTSISPPRRRAQSRTGCSSTACMSS